MTCNYNVFIHSFFDWKFLETNCIKVFVLDEADEMLSRGFKDQIYDVFKNLPAEVQVSGKHLRKNL